MASTSFKIDDYMKELGQLAAAGELDDDELAFHGEILNLAQWGKYQEIKTALAALTDRCRDVQKVKSLVKSNPAEDCAIVTVTLGQTAMLGTEVKAVIADAPLRCEHMFASAFGNKVRLSFLCDRIWAE